MMLGLWFWIMHFIWGHTDTTVLTSLWAQFTANTMDVFIIDQTPPATSQTFIKIADDDTLCKQKCVC